MSRSGYTDDYDYDGSMACYRGVIASATRGKRGQQFFRDLVAALDAMPVKRLVADELETTEGEVCALGALGKAKGANMKAIGNENYDKLGATFNIAYQLAQEVMAMNDEGGPYRGETDEQRWERMRKWAAGEILVTPEELLPEPATPGEPGEPTPDPKGPTP